MKAEGQLPLTLLGPHGFRRGIYFATRYARAAFVPALLIVVVAIVKSGFDRLGTVGGVVFGLGVVLGGLVSSLLSSHILSAIGRARFLRRGKHYIDVNVRRSDVVVTSARDLELNADVMLFCSEGVLTIQNARGEQRRFPLANMVSVDFRTRTIEGAYDDREVSILILTFRDGKLLEFALSLEAAPVWREALTRPVASNSATG
ncbi:MAG TPA: hypothetical protein VLC46_24935 [Thermoanaerobaculia bacterium]|nr:hypothetical protein [Thermoanaerobaculia bacterium]